VLQLDTLHILTANIEDAVNILIKEGCRRAVSNSFYLSVIK
jgi:hypothetical protein